MLQENKKLVFHSSDILEPVWVIFVPAMALGKTILPPSFPLVWCCLIRHSKNLCPRRTTGNQLSLSLERSRELNMERLGITKDRSLNAAKKSCMSSSSKLPRVTCKCTAFQWSSQNHAAFSSFRLFIQKIMTSCKFWLLFFGKSFLA